MLVGCRRRKLSCGLRCKSRQRQPHVRPAGASTTRAHLGGGRNSWADCQRCGGGCLERSQKCAAPAQCAPKQLLLLADAAAAGGCQRGRRLPRRPCRLLLAGHRAQSARRGRATRRCILAAGAGIGVRLAGGRHFVSQLQVTCPAWATCAMPSAPERGSRCGVDWRKSRIAAKKAGAQRTAAAAFLPAAGASAAGCGAPPGLLTS